MSAQVILFGREGCCLCDEAREVLMRVRAQKPFAFEERDIESDERAAAAPISNGFQSLRSTAWRPSSCS